MVGRLRSLVLIALAAGAGAVVGRWVVEARARVEAGEDPLGIDVRDLQVRPQDVIPGIMAGFRVGEPPWSWLHLPGWLVAFGANFLTAAVGGDLDRLREMAEERVLGALGLEPEPTVTVDDVGNAPSAADSAPTGAPSTPVEPTRPSEPQASEHSVWTSENATPPQANGNGTPRAAEAPGFTPLRD